ncbi:nucleotide-binding protein [Microbacterium trichothecenolyticum]|uniref:TIR domain-containing protein n=1 Tax=Microbacterium trichothecenolyticum TaxID=69370 RepID=UPI001C6EF6A2|nr:nucleotide-binding protein [Microbacterium trichothecenolyticum]MBW9121915.1 nucleotide-binding protein [Microbacterium trichothecenolyticum]
MTDYTFQIVAVELDHTFPGRLVEIVAPYARSAAASAIGSHPSLPGYAAHARATRDLGGRMEWSKFETTDASGFRREWTSAVAVGKASPASATPPAERLSGCEQFVGQLGWGDPFERSPLRRNISINLSAARCSVSVTADDEEIQAIGEAVKTLLEDYVKLDLLTRALPPFKVFIGHGGDRKWEAVRDYIEAAEYQTVSFESDDRVGQATLEVVEQMISEASVAVVLMTGVDKLENGKLLARQNVVHEIGFAQGRLGARNTIVLLEDGTEEFTNIAGLTQVRFRAGEVHTTRKEVLACIANRQRDRLISSNPFGAPATS